VTDPADATIRLRPLRFRRPALTDHHVAMKNQDDERIAQLVREGLLVPPTEPMPLDLLRSPLPPASCSVIDALVEEREEAR